MAKFVPAYLKLMQGGKLHHRVEQAHCHLQECDLCARYCYVNRLESYKGAVCRTGEMAVVDSYDIKEMEVKLLEALDYPGLSVIISRRLCAAEQRRFWNKAGKVPTPYYIDTARCNQCLICLKRFSCPAIYTEHEQPLIDKNLCIGCSVCSKVCPKEAIRLLN